MAEKPTFQEFVDDPVRCLETSSIRRSVHKNTPGRPDSDVPAALAIRYIPWRSCHETFPRFSPRQRDRTSGHRIERKLPARLRCRPAALEGCGSLGPPERLLQSDGEALALRCRFPVKFRLDTRPAMTRNS